MLESLDRHTWSHPHRAVSVLTHSKFCHLVAAKWQNFECVRCSRGHAYTTLSVTADKRDGFSPLSGYSGPDL